MIVEIKHNDTSAFERFFKEYSDQLFYYFLKKTKSYPDADELTQQTFIKFWEYRSSLSEEVPEKIQLFYKARIVYIDWLRKQANIRRLYDELAEKENTQFADAAAEPEDEALLLKLDREISKLPRKRKRIFELFQFQGYSYKEIATILNISPKTVDNHIYQAMKQLRKMLSVFLVLIFF